MDNTSCSKQENFGSYPEQSVNMKDGRKHKTQWVWCEGGNKKQADLPLGEVSIQHSRCLICGRKYRLKFVWDQMFDKYHSFYMMPKHKKRIKVEI